MNKIENLIINIKDIKNDIKDIPGYEKVDTKIEAVSDSLICWNCCKCLNNTIISIPHEYINNIFYINGNFCSYNCGLRYIIDNYNGNQLWTNVSLLHIYYRINTGDTNKIKIPPNKKSLKIFGGDLTYEEYHKLSSISVDTFTPPILPINNMEYSHENKKNNKKKNAEYRLYRKNPIKNKNNIYNTMQLIVE